MTQAPTTLQQRRRAATEREIATAAAALFGRQGLDGTTVEQIAARAGVSLRTFYRYFPTKQDAVVPLLRVGAQAWHGHLAALSPGDDLDAAVDSLLRQVLEPLSPGGRDRTVTRTLLRTVFADPDLRRVWDSVNNDSERSLVPLLAALRPEDDPVSVRLLATACSQSVRIALETWAADGADDLDPAAVARDCFRRLAGPR